MLEAADRKPRFQNWKLPAFVAIVILILTIATILIISPAVPQKTHTSSIETLTNSQGTVGRDYYEQFPSPLEATASFDRMLNQSREYRNFSPCFVDRGNRTGEKATMFFSSGSTAKSFWRTVWTQRKTDSSELFYIEAESLDGVVETEKEHSANDSRKEGWRLCKATRF